ncbi:MAG: tRNA 2-thiouridine(34) synthase MnmA [Bacteroidales bacterium]|nr:tRNA 2-thiouridine(34) synthase MnmA [Bacteroidales bacterium]
MGKRVLMAMSGGIDSSVAAMLLMEQGYELEGVTFRTFDSISESCLAREKGCCSVDAIMEARHLAETLGIKHHILDVRELFRDTVIRDFIDQYLKCRTPNPCVLCNPVIKWGRLLEFADEIGCEHMATGHYARVASNEGRHFLKKGVDRFKDQTYFLWRLTSEQLERTLFPLGDLTKDEVREIAAARGHVRLSQKKESEEICFVTDDNYRNFLRENVEDLDERMPAGDIVDTAGRILGRHDGLYNYTVGQRKGLGVALGFPAFVAELQPDTNRLVLGSRDDLCSSGCVVSDLNLPGRPDFGDGERVVCKVRYRSEGFPARLYRKSGGKAEIRFDEPVFAITPGQSAVFYDGDDLLGGGVIQNAIR